MWRCCMETGIHTASKNVCGKQCCAVACTFSAFLLGLQIEHIFSLSSVALLRGDLNWDCFRKSLWKAVLRSCNQRLSFSAWAQFRPYIFSKQCCAVAWTKGIHTAPEKISKKQCCAVAPTYSAFLLRLKIGHIFFSSTVALLRGDWDSDCFRKSFWKAVLRSCNHLLSFSAKA